MKLDKNFLETVKNKVKEYVLTCYADCRIRHLTSKKAGKDTVFVWCECSVKTSTDIWAESYYLGIADVNGYLDIYECNFEDTLTFEVKEGAD